jgi:predicted TIM-barrel fold metal-dependent hydrolase
MQVSELYKRIREEVEQIPLIDTHEHLVSEDIRLKKKIDFFYMLAHYASSDLVAAGMPGRKQLLLLDAERPLEERWEEFAPYWAHVRTTAYGRALLIAANGLFGINDINESTYQELSTKINESNYLGWYAHVLKDKANIEIAILDPIEAFDSTPLDQIDRNFFAPVLHVDSLVTPCSHSDLVALGHKTGVTIYSLDDLLKAIDVAFERAITAGIVGIKIALAYIRTLYFENVTKHDAELVFNRLTGYPASLPIYPQTPPISWSEAKPLQDYLVHQVIERSIENRLPIQIHTGLQEGIGNCLNNSNPLLLVNLFNHYHRGRFDLFHAGYPFQSEMATLGKNFANVYVDMCWLHIISPWVARQTLEEWIETVPANKILGFGGDYLFVEGSYAHARLARDNVTKVLVGKIENGYMNEYEAMDLAHKILRSNAANLFDLNL